MINWHSTAYKLVMQNPHISNKSLANLIGCRPRAIELMKFRLGVSCVRGVNKSVKCGVRGLKFFTSEGRYVVQGYVNGKCKRIGSSVNMEKAFGILDAYRSAVKNGYIQQRAER